MGQRLRKAAGAPRAAWKVVVKYTTDGCTMAPDLNFRDCCVQHDWEYAEHHRESEKKRAEIDRNMRLCIRCRGWFIVAWVYWAMVRAFGWWPYWLKARRQRLTVEEDKAQNGRKRPKLEE